MSEYHKIQTVFKRDPATKHKTLLLGEYSLPEFEYLKDNEWEFTEKVDGTNIRVMFDGKGIIFGGKTDNAQIPSHLLNRLNEKFMRLPTIQRFKDVFNEAELVETCLYGEGYGAKIQKGGGNYRQDQDFVLFDVSVGGWWLQRKDVVDIGLQLEIDVVPVVGRASLHTMVRMVKEGFNSHWGDFPAEGIVARPITELCTRSAHRMITKLKHKDFGG